MKNSNLRRKWRKRGSKKKTENKMKWKWARQIKRNCSTNKITMSTFLISPVWLHPSVYLLHCFFFLAEGELYKKFQSVQKRMKNGTEINLKNHFWLRFLKNKGGFQFFLIFSSLLSLFFLFIFFLLLHNYLLNHRA